MTIKPILVAGVGNIFLGDDGFGPEVARRVAAVHPRPDVRVVDYGIRGMHLAYDLLDGYRALILIDLIARGAPGEVQVLEVARADLAGGAFDAHGMDPVAVLGTLEALGGELPRTFVVGCRPVSLDEQIGLSSVVAASVGAAVEAVTAILDGPLATIDSGPVDGSDPGARSDRFSMDLR